MRIDITDGGNEARCCTETETATRMVEPFRHKDEAGYDYQMGRIWPPQRSLNLGGDMEAIVICSGGMDSATLAYHVVKERNMDTQLLSFDYGQSHKKELDYAKALAARLFVPWNLIDITTITKYLKGAGLTDSTIEIPDGHYSDPIMKLTVVPNRNAIMLSIAFGVAAGMKAEIVAAGMHSGDHPIYPDCRPDFVNAFDEMEVLALDGVAETRLYTPFIHIDKTEIVRRGEKLGVPWGWTWSCYKGRELHCGKCGTCVERREAFELAKVDDPTVYENVLDQEAV